MSIDYSAALIIGLPRKAFADQEKLEEWLDNEQLFVCPPYYDGAGDDGAICGIYLVSTGCYTPKIVDLAMQNTLGTFTKFEELTGMPGKLWLSPYGY